VNQYSYDSYGQFIFDGNDINIYRYVWSNSVNFSDAFGFQKSDPDSNAQSFIDSLRAFPGAITDTPVNPIRQETNLEKRNQKLLTSL